MSLGATAMLVLLLLLAVAVQSNFRNLKEANLWNVHTYQVLERVNRLSNLLDRHEAQLRGFALTGEADYLRQLRQSNGVGVRALADLRVMAGDPPTQQRRLDVIEPQFLVYKARFVTPFMQSNIPAEKITTLREISLQQTQARAWKTSQLRESLSEMELVERQLVTARARNLESAQHQTTRTLIGGSVFMVLLAILLTALLAHAVRAQQDANTQMNQLNESLIGEISERRIIEESLRASEVGFRHLAEDSLDMICRHAPDGTLTYVSPAARPLLGYSPTEMIGVHPGRFLFDKLRVDPEVSPIAAFAAQLKNTQAKPLLLCYRHAKGHRVWLEVVGHAIVDSQSGEAYAWHTASRDVSARVREEKERARLTAGLRAVVEIADDLIGAPNEEELLKRAVEMMYDRVGLKRCSIYLSQPDGNGEEFSSLMRGTFGTDEHGAAIAENDLFYNTKSDPNPDDITPAPGERWIVRQDQIRYVWRDGARVELPEPGWLARTPITTRNNIIGLFFHDSAPDDVPHDGVAQQLVVVFCSLLGALLERGRSQLNMTRQQRLLESLMENAPLFLYSVDVDEKFTLATGNFLSVIGFTPSEMLGSRMTEIRPESSFSVQGMRRALKGETMQQELEFGGRWLKMWRQPIHDENGEINGMIGIGMDITQQHRAQIALQESETRYRQVADSLQDVLFQTNAAAHWTFLNPAWTEITGIAIENSLGAPCARALHPDDCADFFALVEAARAAQSADVPARVLRFMTSHGDVRWLEVALRANFNEQGNFRGTAGTLRDVTEKVRAEAVLSETLEMQRAILQVASYAIVSTDENGIIKTFNPAAESLFGVSAEEVIDKQTPTIFYDAMELRTRALGISQEFGETVEPNFETLVARAQRGGDGEAEWNCLRADGVSFPMRISHSVLHNQNGAIAGYVSIGYDLTETHRAEKLKNEFVSVVSHELRTPLTSIRGALGLLSGGVAGVLPPSAMQMIDIAQKNAERLVLLINDILDIEKIESGKMRFETVEVSLSGLLESALESNRGYAQTLGVEIELEPLPSVLRNATVLGDEARLQQVMSNLISNACKWTPKGSHVQMRASLARDSSAENPRISVEVQDAGPGVPLEFESRLFQRFAQADGSATREKGGTGLGLAVTQAIIEKHDGTVGYRAPDALAGRVGATFHFELAAQNVSFEMLSDEPIEMRKSMLVVEDDEEVAALLRAILEHAGYAVEVAHSRARTLELARSEAHFDGITLDLLLPDCQGFELLEELRELPAIYAVPIVIISSFGEDRAQYPSRPIEHWLGKPVQPEQLLSTISSWYPRVNKSSENGKARVLHVEDDRDVSRVVAMILGDCAEVVTASTLAQARVYLRSEAFDLALLDIGLPDGNGLDLLEQLSACEPPVPALIFSAREEEAETASNLAAALIKSRTPNQALLAKVEELLGGRTPVTD